MKPDLLLPEEGLPTGRELMAEGAAEARDWQVGPSAFLTHVGADSEFSFKQRMMEQRRVMQHAQLG